MSSSDFESTYRELMQEYMDVNRGPRARLDALEKAAVMAEALGDSIKRMEVTSAMNRLKQKYGL